MILRIMTSKRPYIMELLPEVGGFEIEADEGEEMAMQAVNENGKQMFRFGDWAKIDKALNKVDKSRCGNV